MTTMSRLSYRGKPPTKENQAGTGEIAMLTTNENRARNLHMIGPNRVSGIDPRINESEPLIRWAGLVALLAAVVASPAWIASVVREDPLSSWPIIASFVALLLAVPAIFAAQSSRLGRLGRIGFVLTMIGGIFEVAGMTTVLVIQAKVGLHGHEKFIMSGSVAPHMLALSALVLLFYLGVVLFGVATVRAGIFPRRSGQLVIAGSVAMVAGSLPDITGLVAAGAILLFAGFAWMGWQLSVRQPETVSP